MKNVKIVFASLLMLVAFNCANAQVSININAYPRVYGGYPRRPVFVQPVPPPVMVYPAPPMAYAAPPIIYRSPYAYGYGGGYGYGRGHHRRGRW